jgi:hypothetical protein
MGRMDAGVWMRRFVVEMRPADTRIVHTSGRKMIVPRTMGSAYAIRNSVTVTLFALIGRTKLCSEKEWWYLWIQ